MEAAASSFIIGMSFQTERGDQGSRDTRAAPTAWRRPTSLFRTKRGIARTVHGDILPQNVTDFFTPAPAERLHQPLRLSLEMGFK